MTNFKTPKENAEETDRAEYAEGRDIMFAIGAENPYQALMELDKLYKSVDESERGLMAVMKALSAEYDRLMNRANEMQRHMAGLAAQLARAGSYDHKAKNEVILSVVARLLDLSGDNLNGKDEDDIPF